MVELITLEELEKEIKAKEGEIREIQIDIGGIDVIRDKTIVVNTLQVAEIFKKQHKNVISKVKEIIKEYPELLNKLTFKPIEYIDKRNRKQLMYEMNRDGFAILANKFTGKIALGFTIKYVKALGKKVEIFKDKKSLGVFESCSELERQSEKLFGVKLLQGRISMVCTGRYKQYKGYTFKYITKQEYEERVL